MSSHPGTQWGMQGWSKRGERVPVVRWSSSCCVRGKRSGARHGHTQQASRQAYPAFSLTDLHNRKLLPCLLAPAPCLALLPAQHSAAAPARPRCPGRQRSWSAGGTCACCRPCPAGGREMRGKHGGRRQHQGGLWAGSGATRPQRKASGQDEASGSSLLSATKQLPRTLEAPLVRPISSAITCTSKARQVCPSSAVWDQQLKVLSDFSCRIPKPHQNRPAPFTVVLSPPAPCRRA